jgi:hydroxymethylpyrimidine/phosphomethylpyrimidine kinase
MQTVLTIAGFDPSSGAGVTADLMVFAAHGLFGTACITALTVQSTLGVRSTHPTPAPVVDSTLDCLAADIPPAGIKIGMLSGRDNIRIICRFLGNIHQTHEVQSRRFGGSVVLDPVLRSTSGRELLDPAAIEALQEQLLPLVDWVTPNLDELKVLSGQSVSDRHDLRLACQALQNQLFEKNGGHRLGIFATGGHLDPPDDFLLLPSGEEVWLPGEHIATRSTHGTGCALSSAFLSRLVLGDPPKQAALAAKSYVAEAMKNATAIGSGNGPLHHLWPLLRVKD